MRKKLLIPVILIGLMAIGTTYGAFLTYKAYVEIYGYKYPLGQIEIDTMQVPDIEGLEAREDYIGEMRVYTYSDEAQLVVQLLQVSHLVTNFRSFTVKIALPLDMVFCVDLTGSMMPYIETAKAQLIELMSVIRSMHKAGVQVGVVGFKDYPGDTVICPLTDDLMAVEAFISGLTAVTGAGVPQSHYLGFEAALELFVDKPESWTNDRMVVLVGDSEPGVDDVFEFEPGGATQSSVLALAEAGIKVHSVLCGPEESPEFEIYKWYADVTGGHFVRPVLVEDPYWGLTWQPARLVPVVTSNPTWLVKLTTVTPFDSFQLPLASSPPTEKAGYYRFEIYVDFFCKAIPWHEWWNVELAANLEKAEPKPEFPPPYFPPGTEPAYIELYIDPAPPYSVGPEETEYFDFTVTFMSTPKLLTLEVFDPDGVSAYYNEWDLTGASSPYSGSDSWTVPLGAMLGYYTVWVKYYCVEIGPAVPEASAARVFIVG